MCPYTPRLTGGDDGRVTQQDLEAPLERTLWSLLGTAAFKYTLMALWNAVAAGPSGIERSFRVRLHPGLACHAGQGWVEEYVSALARRVSMMVK